ncbi:MULTISPECIES: branched-chain amino acid aminotransferase [Xanthobacteraceae]|uniref:Probable branched-chain-amino-acid aminotransferase n=1 Tax=Labrys monachus TaxID=217067 RepID=A0ABU0FFX4_9HYPH|nr:MULTISPECIES: branched-chain amino acid aminotransferase [Xanthobacteraceae]MDQ0393502.1 branched-chain amino acid aminotransferase [Labrys monachus]
MPFPVTRTIAPKPIPSDVGNTFGAYFTDHMFVMDYTEGRGWHNHRIGPFGPIPVHPSCSAIQYGQSIFDGYKAYRCDDGIIRLFRPKAHLERINRSTARLCMPAIEPDTVLDAMVQLVGLDRDWVPHQPGKALYVRETMIGTEGFMAVRPAKTYTFMIFLSPVGNYYAEGADPVKILVSDKHVRAARGGIGAAKAAANYSASLLATEEAKALGHTQVLWLDSVERRYLEEVGTMNVMLKVGDEIVTPPLTDSILPGVTRLTALHLLREWGLKVSERQIAIDDVLAGIEDESIEEIWGLGTAAVVSPIGELTYRGRSRVVGGGKIGPTTAKLYDAITKLHTQAGNDPYGWRVDVL